MKTILPVLTPVKHQLSCFLPSQNPNNQPPRNITTVHCGKYTISHVKRGFSDEIYAIWVLLDTILQWSKVLLIGILRFPLSGNSWKYLF